MSTRGRSSWLVTISVMRAALFSGGLILTVACGGSGDAPEITSGSSMEAAGGAGLRVDMDAIFPAGAGRDLLLNNCQSCHTWVPVVVLQMNEDEWFRWSVEHRQRVTGMSDEEFATLYQYLVSNFNPSRPVPELPPALLESWTTY